MENVSLAKRQSVLVRYHRNVQNAKYICSRDGRNAMLEIKAILSVCLCVTVHTYTVQRIEICFASYDGAMNSFLTPNFVVFSTGVHPKECVKARYPPSKAKRRQMMQVRIIH